MLENGAYQLTGATRLKILHTWLVRANGGLGHTDKSSERMAHAGALGGGRRRAANEGWMGKIEMIDGNPTTPPYD